MNNTPRDVFYHIGAFATLYLAALALITVWFRMIDVMLPDALRDAYYYADPYSGPMRFAIASLIVLTPVSLMLFRQIRRDMRSNPGRRELGVRRWLVYITLFITGATIVGDLIWLLNAFLGGTLALAFALKAGVLLVIMGGAFWYFLSDMRNAWSDERRASRIIGAGVGALVALSILAGFAVMGSPAQQRDVRLDQQQVSDLSTLQYQIVTFWQQNERLPESLQELESDILESFTPEAPAGRDAYTYEVTGERTFELCATFAQSSNVYSYRMSPDAYGIAGGASWEHDAEHTCFSRTIDPNLIRPARMIN